MRHFLAAIAACLCMGAAHATTYQYIGHTYTSPVGTYTTSMSITGTFETASPLPANMPPTAIGPGGLNIVTAWSFSDGVNTYTNANSGVLGGNDNFFNVSTDSTGSIVDYIIGFAKPVPPNTLGQLGDAVGIVRGGDYQARDESPCDLLSPANVCIDFQQTGAAGYVDNQENGGGFVRLAPLPAPAAVPALGGSALAALMAALALAAVVVLRRRV